MHVELDCPWIPVSDGLRILAPDGRSFRLRGAKASTDGRIDVPADVARHLYEVGVATKPSDLRVAVVSDLGCSDDLVRGLTARRIDVATWVRAHPNTCDLRRISGHTHPDVHVVVICPRTLLGGRDMAEQCHRAGIPSVIAWGHHGWALLGPINDHRPGCQHCVDMAMAARDPDWVTVARSMTEGGYDPAVTEWLVSRVEDTALSIRDSTITCQTKTFHVRTTAGERSIDVPAQPGCHCWLSEEKSCNTVMRSAA
ncbi:hypothetical protein FYJ43_04850 [Cutibacterium sp. WCA-380-WT-3A]|uniref:TOMM leader peptide-binding protein n=2 Tax=Cutibacterium porci TaxID=2605781 RepID=A0A7K0J617_9ACTN|nr:hypothetical protein [Cutibacterium porci]